MWRFVSIKFNRCFLKFSFLLSLFKRFLVILIVTGKLSLYHLKISRFSSGFLLKKVSFSFFLLPIFSIELFNESVKHHLINYLKVTFVSYHFVIHCTL